MKTGGASSQAAMAKIRAGLAELAQVDPADLSADGAEELAVELARAGDRIGGELARVAHVVAESGSWRTGGATSPAAWMSRRTGTGLGRARAALELGAAMDAVPELDSAVRSGELSPGAAAAVVPAIEDDGFGEIAGALIDELGGLTPAKARTHVEEWRAVANPVDDAERRRTAVEGRTLTFRPLGDGTTHVEGIVPDATARTLRQALAHLADQQRLDGSGRTREQRRVDALDDLAAAYNRGEVKGGRNLPRVIVTSTLDEFLDRNGISRDSFSGDVITSAEIDRLCCDAVVHRYLTDQTGAVMNFGRGKRTASPNQFLAMVARDRGCRHPGCERPPQWCEAHHLREFAARGGLTDIDEMVLICHHHHHALHEGGWVLSGDPNHLIFTGPDGRVLHSPLPGPGDTSLPRRGTKDAA